MNDRAVFLAADANGRQIVSVHAKLTYRLLPSGECSLAEDQQPFLNMRGDEPDDGLVHPEMDLVPQKAATDLIVIASAHSPRGRATTRMLASLACGPVERRFLVSGPRRCLYRGRGSWRFSESQPFETMPLRFENAYGGCDPHAPAPAPKNLLEMMRPHPGMYPRNPAGRGYVVTETHELLDGLVLPSVENPEDPLTPERLVTGSPAHWWRQPLPWSCDWFHPTWYPRCLHFGGLPDLPDDDSMVEEVRRGYVPPGQNARFARAGISEIVNPQFGDAAAPGLVLPFLRGHEAIRLRGMTPEGELVVRLPGERPRFQVRVGGKLLDLAPVVNRVLVSVEEMGLYIVWHAAFAPSHPLPERLPPAAPEEPRPGWDLGGIEALVDGQVAPPMLV